MTLSELQKAVDAKLKHDLAVINKHYGLDLQMPVVTYDLTGTTAGKANYRTWVIRLNKQIMIDNADRFIDRTVPHELAHLVCDRVYPEAHQTTIIIGNNGRYRRSKRDVHGKPWQSIMHVLGVADPTRCHTYDVSNVKRKSNMYDAYCGKCNHPMPITQKRLNKIQRGFSYFHTGCGGALTLGSSINVAAQVAIVKPQQPKHNANDVKAPRPGSKLHDCLVIYQSNQRLSRMQLIALFVQRAGCTPKGASTYVSTCQKLTQQGIIG